MKDLATHVKIVVPCRNEGEWLRVTVDSILERTASPSFEVFVLANGDTQTDFSFIDKTPYRECVNLKRVDRPLGVGKCINAAVTPGDASHYVFLDAHCVISQDDWLERTVDCLERHPQASMVQPEVSQFVYEGDPVVNGHLDCDSLHEEYAAYSIAWTWPYENPRAIATIETKPLANKPYEAMAGGGMVVFARAETFHRLGRYDHEVEGWYPETMDYCVGGWLLGHPMLVDPTVRIWHRVKTETDTFGSFEHAVHGVLRTAYKYLSPRRRDLAETLFRQHGLTEEVQRALSLIHKGGWLRERLSHLRACVHDDDWLFSKFDVYEERTGIFD